MMCKLKGRMDKGGHYDVQILKGRMDKGGYGVKLQGGGRTALNTLHKLPNPLHLPSLPSFSPHFLQS